MTEYAYYEIGPGIRISIGPKTRLTFEEYNTVVSYTHIYPDRHQIVYPLLGLSGEVGEVLNKYKKVLRGDKTLADAKADLLKELGDCFWYLFAVIQDLDGNVGQVLADNATKLLKRKADDKLKGDGDNR